MIGADVFFVKKNNALLCIVDYNSNFPIVKRADSPVVNDLVKTAKIVFA